jgi:hypothetical protein
MQGDLHGLDGHLLPVRGMSTCHSVVWLCRANQETAYCSQGCAFCIFHNYSCAWDLLCCLLGCCCCCCHRALVEPSQPILMPMHSKVLCAYCTVVVFQV